MTTKHTTTVVSAYPRCDFHANRLAAYDAKTVHGPWANLCTSCFMERGIGVGLGKGQRLVLKGQQ